MRAEAWPYLVGRGFDHGYRVFLAPSFLAESEHYLLEYASSGGVTPEGVAVVREVLGSAQTPMTLLYRVVRPTADRYGLPGGGLLTDETFRPISVFEGFVLRLSGTGVRACEPTHADFEVLRETVAPVFRAMWRAPARTEAARADPVAPTSQTAMRMRTTTSRREGQTPPPDLGPDPDSDAHPVREPDLEPSRAPGPAQRWTPASDPAPRDDDRLMELDFIEPFVVPNSAAAPETDVVPHTAAEQQTGAVSGSAVPQWAAARERGAQVARVARQTSAFDRWADEPIGTPNGTLRRVRGAAAFMAVVVAIAILAVMVALLRDSTATGPGGGTGTHGSAAAATTARPQSPGETRLCSKPVPSTKPTPSATWNSRIREPFRVYLRMPAPADGPPTAKEQPQAPCADPSG
jgi:hypothetical protein